MLAINKRKLSYFILAIFISFGFFLRVYKLGQQSLWIDEGFTLTQAKAIQLHGYPKMLSGELEIKDVLLPYILNLLLPFSDNIFLLRLIPAIFGTLSIFVIFLIADYLFGMEAGLISSFLMSFSYWNIAWSRQLRPYSLLIFFVLLFFLFLIVNHNTGKKRYLMLSVVSILLAAISKTAGFILLFPFLGYLLFKRKYLLSAVIFFAIASIGFIFHGSFLKAMDIAIVNYAAFYFFGYLWLYFGLIFTLAVFAIFVALFKKRNFFTVSSTIFLISSFCLFSFFVLVNQRRYLLFLIPILFLYAAYGLFLLAEKKQIRFIILAFIVIFDLYFFKSMSFLPKATYSLEEYTPQPNFAAAYNAISKNFTSEDFIISPYPYMDLIYLKKANFALPISYTGRDEDSTRNMPTEHYSGVPVLFQSRQAEIDEVLKKIQSCRYAYFILDSMALSRVDNSIVTYLENNGELVFEEKNIKGQEIVVYRLTFH